LHRVCAQTARTFMGDPIYGYDEAVMAGAWCPADRELRHHAVDGARSLPDRTADSAAGGQRERPGAVHPGRHRYRPTGLAEHRWPPERFDLGPWRPARPGLVGGVAAPRGGGDARFARAYRVRQYLRGTGSTRAGAPGTADPAAAAYQHLRRADRHDH